MITTTETSDGTILDILREQGPLGVAELAEATGVTATAVRQRLTRLMGRGDVDRVAERSGRGRPSHRYRLTDQGRRTAGTNYDDLAVTLWQEIRGVKDAEVRRGLLQRIAERLADRYAGQIRGATLAERMQSLSRMLTERKVPFQVDQSGELPVLTAVACPYPDLAEQDHSICAMERMMFSELLGQGVKLTECRLDGASCCTFEGN